MKVFISWSGEKSKQVALLLEEWIKMVIQASEPWVSTNIQSGSLWFQELNEQLKDVTIGIVCITSQNRDKPWILFETGALAKGLSTNRVCTLLVDLKNEDIEQPLAQFNHTYPDHDGMFKLMTTINTHLEKSSLPQHILSKVFEKNWLDFESRMNEIRRIETPGLANETKRGSEEILNEVLQTIRGFDRRLQNIEVKREATPPNILMLQHTLIQLKKEKNKLMNELTDELTEPFLSRTKLQLEQIISEIQSIEFTLADYQKNFF